MIEEFLSEFSVDSSLASTFNACVTIKGFNQLAIVQKIIERKGKKNLGLTSVDDVKKRSYSNGKILVTDLARSKLDEAMLFESNTVIDCIEPYHVAINEASLAYTDGYRFQKIDLQSGNTQAFTNEWMAYLHTVDFSADGRRMLLVSTGFDTIQEVELDSGELCWEWNGWDHGFTYSSQTETHFVRTVEHAAQIKRTEPTANVIIVDEPTNFPKEGLPTQATPLNLNGVFYGHDGQIIATAYHHPEIFIIDRSGDARLIDLGLSHPHSFRPVTIAGNPGYMVANTGEGFFLLLDEQFEIVKKIDTSTLPADDAKKQGFGEWMQTVSLVDEQGIFASVDALRDGIHLIDIVNRRRRFIANPPHWTIQTVTRIPDGLPISGLFKSQESLEFA